jgi:hypothetical protein
MLRSRVSSSSFQPYPQLSDRRFIDEIILQCGGTVHRPGSSVRRRALVPQPRAVGYAEPTTPSQSPSTSRHCSVLSTDVTRAGRSRGPSTSSTARASANLRAPANGDELRARPARAPSARLGSADAPTPPSTGSWRACRAIPPRCAEDARLQPAQGPRAVHTARRHLRALPRRGAGPIPTRLPGRGERPQIT